MPRSRATRGRGVLSFLQRRHPTRVGGQAQEGSVPHPQPRPLSCLDLAPGARGRFAVDQCAGLVGDAGQGRWGHHGRQRAGFFSWDHVFIDGACVVLVPETAVAALVPMILMAFSDVLSTLPDELDPRVAAGEHRLSVGQAARVGIAWEDPARAD